MENDNNLFLTTAKEAALKAGEYIKENFGKNHSVEFKSSTDIGIKEDEESESIILNIIRGEFPNHNIFSEEIGLIDNQNNYTWYIDPLDGTNNYSAGIPYFSISISLLKGEEIMLGVVYNPIAKQMFEATKNGGAYLNGEKISPSISKGISKSVASFIQGHLVSSNHEILAESEGIKKRMEKSFRRVLSTWAPALDWCLLASGGIDFLVSFESELEDMFAGLLIAKESGIIIKDFNGKDFQIGSTKILASNQNTFSEANKQIFK